jgi:hypothetical protein
MTAETARVALRLLERRRNLLGLLLGLDHGVWLEPDEQHVVSDAVAVRLGPRRDLGDRAVLALLGSRAAGPAQGLAVDLPAGVAELRVDQHSGLALVELGGLRGGGGLGDDDLFLLGRRGGGGRRHGLDDLGLLGRCLLEVALVGEGEALPFAALGLRGLAQRSLLGSACALGFEECACSVGVGTMSVGLRACAGSILLQGAQGRRRIGWRHVVRWLPSTPRVCIAERLVEPAGEPIRDRESIERLLA